MGTVLKCNLRIVRSTSSRRTLALVIMTRFPTEEFATPSKPPTARPCAKPDEVEYKLMWGLYVSEEALDYYSDNEIKDKATLAREWFAKSAIINLNKKHSPRR